MSEHQIKRYTFLRFTLEPLDRIDILSLVILFLSVIIDFFSADRTPKLHVSNSLTIGILSWAFISTGTFGIRFRKAYFSGLWFLLSLLLLINNYTICYLPLFCFIQYHFFRWRFWKKNNREFIPFDANRSGYIKFYSKAEARYGNKTDLLTMEWIFYTGFAIMLTCLFGMVGVKA
jgi:hypothetical protein